MQHTPGPWRVNRDERGRCFINGDGVVKMFVCTVDAPVGALHEGNARLIAAAPDALEFAIFYDAYMADQFPDGLQTNYDNKTLHPRAAEAWGRCKAYIAKAMNMTV